MVKSAATFTTFNLMVNKLIRKGGLNKCIPFKMKM